MSVIPQRPSPYLEPLEQAIDVVYFQEDGQTVTYGRCLTPNDILDARLDLGLVGIDSVMLVPVKATNTAHMGV